MHTDLLIDMLARGAGPAPRAAVARRLLPAIVLGLLSSSALAVLVIGLLPSVMFQTPTPWTKIVYGCALAAAAAVLTARLARPLGHWQAPRKAVAAVIAAMALLGAIALASAPPDEKMPVLMGQTWQLCPWVLMGLSLPSLAALLWAVKGLAPTRSKEAGFACGLLAGALGAIGYALACPESSPTFVAVWYTLGILLTALLGRAIGPFVLRW